MGEAKKRGTYEQRKALAEARNKEQALVMADVKRRRPSPKHKLLMTALYGMALSTTIDR